MSNLPCADDQRFEDASVDVTFTGEEIGGDVAIGGLKTVEISFHGSELAKGSKMGQTGAGAGSVLGKAMDFRWK